MYKIIHSTVHCRIIVGKFIDHIVEFAFVVSVVDIHTSFEIAQETHGREIISKKSGEETVSNKN